MNPVNFWGMDNQRILEYVDQRNDHQIYQTDKQNQKNDVMGSAQEISNLSSFYFQSIHLYFKRAAASMIRKS